MSDKEVILKIKDGELNHYYFIVKKYTRIIYQFITRKIFDKEEVEDLVQNTFISFYKAINRFDEERPVLPYLYQIAKNEMKMYFRSRKQTFSLDERVQIELQDDPFFTEDYERVLSTLPQEQKKTLKLLIEGYSYQEIAQQIKKPLNTVRTIIRRARLKIKKNHESH